MQRSQSHWNYLNYVVDFVAIITDAKSWTNLCIFSVASFHWQWIVACLFVAAGVNAARENLRDEMWAHRWSSIQKNLSGNLKQKEYPKKYPESTLVCFTWIQLCTLTINILMQTALDPGGVVVWVRRLNNEPRVTGTELLLRFPVSTDHCIKLKM